MVQNTSYLLLTIAPDTYGVRDLTINISSQKCSNLWSNLFRRHIILLFVVADQITNSRMDQLESGATIKQLPENPSNRTHTTRMELLSELIVRYENEQLPWYRRRLSLDKSLRLYQRRALSSYVFLAYWKIFGQKRCNMLFGLRIEHRRERYERKTQRPHMKP